MCVTTYKVTYTLSTILKLKINNLGWVIVVLIALYKESLPEYACLLKISISMKERVTQTVPTNIELK